MVGRQEEWKKTLEKKSKRKAPLPAYAGKPNMPKDKAATVGFFHTVPEGERSSLRQGRKGRPHLHSVIYPFSSNPHMYLYNTEQNFMLNIILWLKPTGQNRP